MQGAVHSKRALLTAVAEKLEAHQRSSLRGLWRRWSGAAAGSRRQRQRLAAATALVMRSRGRAVLRGWRAETAAAATKRRRTAAAVAMLCGHRAKAAWNSWRQVRWKVNVLHRFLCNVCQSSGTQRQCCSVYVAQNLNSPASLSTPDNPVRDKHALKEGLGLMEPCLLFDPDNDMWQSIFSAAMEGVCNWMAI